MMAKLFFFRPIQTRQRERQDDHTDRKKRKHGAMCATSLPPPSPLLLRLSDRDLGELSGLGTLYNPFLCRCLS
jgi:hypothetical protein